MNKSAIISSNEKYRYGLLRSWDIHKPYVMFIMLNPSTADGVKDDPTITRCINFAKSWGYGGLWVGNLYAYRATDPKELKNTPDPWGPENFMQLQSMVDRCKIIVCAWGNNKGRPSRIFNKFDNLFYLGLSNNGTPKHPLYLKKGLKPIAFNPKEIV